VHQIKNSLKKPFAELLLSIADDKFVLGHRNADWTGLAPILEEDIAFSSLAQDELAHASALYQVVGDFLGTSADKLAFGRKPEEYRCAQLIELSDEFDWAVALVRGFFCDHLDMLRLNRLTRSSYPPVAPLAARLAAEEEVHVQHVDSWLPRLGRGSDEGRQRLQASLDRLSPLASMLVEPTEGIELLEKEGLYPGSEAEMFERWSTELKSVSDQAGLKLNLEKPAAAAVGGRRGRHSDSFLPMLDELTEVYRIEPGAAW
jgi:ring-1,2-phenylacetyl-CoA epoxidase subunit PaaC